jgi:hypothetical protein
VSLAEVSVGEERKKRLHYGQGRHLGTSVFLIMYGVGLVPYTAVVVGQGTEMSRLMGKLNYDRC